MHFKHGASPWGALKIMHLDDEYFFNQDKENLSKIKMKHQILWRMEDLFCTGEIAMFQR